MIDRIRLAQITVFLLLAYDMGSTDVLASQSTSTERSTTQEQRVSGVQAVDLLPDIIIRESDLLDHDIVTNIQFGHKHLRLSNGTPNIGDGPLYARGLGGSGLGGGNTQDVNQRIYRDDGTFWERLAGKFIFHQFHDHIHVEDWCTYRLREVLPGNGVGSVVATGGKTSFCILDLDVYNAQLPNYDPDGFFFSCGNTTQGLSVGWVDIYTKDLEGQNIDITGLPDGVYWLESEADPENHFLEKDETNNITRIQVVIGNPGAIAPDNYEPDNTFDSVSARALGAPNSPFFGPCDPFKKVTAGIHQVDNVDVFKFYCNSTGTSADSLMISFQHSIGDLDLQLCNSSGTGIRQSDGSTNREKILLNGVPEGWYFVKVYGYLNATNPYYELTIDPPSNTAPTVNLTSHSSGTTNVIHGIETFPATWTSSDPENDERWVTIWLNRTPAYTDSATLIPTSLYTPSGAEMQIVNTSYLDTGVYYVGASITDGGTTTWDWSAGTVRVWSASSLGTISGSVVNGALSPLEDVQVTIVSSGSTDTTGSTGAYAFPQLFPGTYSVYCSHPNYADTTIFGVVVESADTTQLQVVLRSLCQFIPGDVNGNNDGPNVLDLNYLVSYFFGGGSTPTNLEAANINGQSGVNVLDLNYFVMYLFGGGPAPTCQ